MSIRFFLYFDYQQLKAFYEKAGWFDPHTDSEEKITKQIEKDPNSLLLAIDENKIVGTVTLLFTGRLGLFFRLISDSEEVKTTLLKKGEEIFKEHGYNEVHIIAPEEALETQESYKDYGFKKGRAYRWFWKKIG